MNTSPDEKALHDDRMKRPAATLDRVVRYMMRESYPVFDTLGVKLAKALERAVAADNQVRAVVREIQTGE